jgi:hypothetical protein
MVTLPTRRAIGSGRSEDSRPQDADLNKKDAGFRLGTGRPRRAWHHHFARNCKYESTQVNYWVVAARDELGLAVNAQRKNLESHFSQRNGLREIMAKILLSMMPLRLDRRIRALRHSGQLIIMTLLAPNRHPNCQFVLCRKGLLRLPLLRRVRLNKVAVEWYFSTSR